jgi:hypothetical protein
MAVAIVAACEKRSYPTRLMANRDIQTHPSWAPVCEKCADGLELQVYRCRDDAGHLWHVGHGYPEQEDDAMMATADAQSAPLRGGDTWVAVSARGRGQPVEIVRVNPVSVYFRATGRGADASQKFKLGIEAFRVRYAPLHLAEDRQKQMARDLRSGIAPIPVIMPTPVEEPEPDPEPEVAPGTIAAAPEVAAPKRPAPGGRPPKLTAEQAREVFLLMRDGTANKQEVAKTYGIHTVTVADIARRRIYRWATEGLSSDPTPLPVAAPPTLPNPDPVIAEEPPVQIVAPPIDIRPEPCEQTATISPIYSAGRLVPATLLADMADALDVLVEYAGKPLPRYLKLDLDAIRSLVVAARVESQDGAR